jgi:hypothetical protein
MVYLPASREPGSAPVVKRSLIGAAASIKRLIFARDD